MKKLALALALTGSLSACGTIEPGQDLPPTLGLLFIGCSVAAGSPQLCLGL